MALDPRTREDIYQSLRQGLTGRIRKLTNFAENSFNYVWTQAYAQELHKQEVATTAVQLSGWADYVGKELTQDDLEDLGIYGAEPEEINQFVADQHLDEFAKAFGVSRDTGARATGILEITTNESTTIPEGTEFGTEPDSSGNYLSFYTVEDVTSDTAETVEVEIRAGDVGNEYNVGANMITYMPNPPTGVSSVTNPESTSGGTNPQTNEELRQDIKNAVVESTEGGTTAGVAGYIEENTGSSDVIVEEKFTGDDEHGNYPHADVIVLGGTKENVNQAIEESHPSGVEHILERPTEFNINISADLEGGDIETSSVEEEISEYFNQLRLGDDVIRDKLIQIIMNADEDIHNIQNLHVEIDSEPHTYDSNLSSHPVYTLEKAGYIGDQGITQVVGTLNGESGYEFVEDTDWRQYDDDGDGDVDSVNWDVDGDGTVDGDNPDEDTLFYVNYTVDDNVPIANTEVAQLNQNNIQVV